MLLYSPFTLLVQYYSDSAFLYFDNFKRVVLCLEGRFSRRWRFCQSHIIAGFLCLVVMPTIAAWHQNVFRWMTEMYSRFFI